MQIQTCKICNRELEINKFYKCPHNNGYLRKCKECCITEQKERNKTTQQKREKSLEQFLKSSFWSIRFRSRERRLHNFNLEFEDILEKYQEQNGKCAISGIEMTHIVGQGRIQTNISVDRINSNEGYTKNNIHLVCDIVNVMKQTLTIDELIDWCNKIIKHNTT